MFNEVFGVSTKDTFSGTIRLKLFFQDTLISSLVLKLQVTWQLKSKDLVNFSFCFAFF